MVKAMFWENCAVVHKPHRLNEATDRVWEEIMKPLVDVGALSFCDAADGRALTQDPRLAKIYFTGGTSTAQNPTHTYTAVGTYTISLTATNAQGSDTATKTNYITVTEPGVPGPYRERSVEENLDLGEREVEPFQHFDDLGRLEV